MIEIAKLSDLEEIMQFITEAKKEMHKRNNPQWGPTVEDYPNTFVFQNDIENKTLYIYKEDEKIKGCITIKKDKGEYNYYEKNLGSEEHEI